MNAAQLKAVLWVNILDIITTIVYMRVDDRAQELSPIYSMVWTAYWFFAIKMIMVPFLFFVASKYFFKKEDMEAFTAFIVIFFWLASLNNILNIILFFIRN